MQEDVYRGDGLNLYVYCANNPVMYYDPSGYEEQNVGCRISDNATNNNQRPNTDSEDRRESITNTAITHSSVGDFTYDPKTGAVSKMKGGEYVGNLPKNANVADGVAVFEEYNGVRVGVIRTNRKISIIFSDSNSQP